LYRSANELANEAVNTIITNRDEDFLLAQIGWVERFWWYSYVIHDKAIASSQIIRYSRFTSTTRGFNLSYIEQSLNEGERILYRTGKHWIVLLVPGLFGGFFVVVGTVMLIVGDGGSMRIGLVSGGFGAFIIGLAVLRRNATEMAVTSKRVIVKIGLLRRNTIELFLPRVESVRVEQGLLGRMLGYGNIVVRGTGGSAEPFKDVRSPMEFRRQVQQQSEVRAMS
jgi:hypothetical protein